MNSSYYIKSFCSIKNNKISLNGNLVFENEAEIFSDFIKTAYKSLDTNYSKFFKMDALSKLAFLTADVLLKNEKLDVTQENDIAIVFSNKASSLDTDRKYQESIQDTENYYPSPSVFVYTLPNICIGEICIKYKLYSENSFFIFDSFNAQHLLNYATSLLANNKANSVLCGWVELDGEHYEGFLYLVTKTGITLHNNQNLLKLYNS
ncbi:3-oxoacyl-ACP synthase [Dokdonia sp.]|uniref:3-oxoacyl-ACP synthase n=1 Tax=Dokdonia sp. TaxID=2024995 RepID=UPI003267F587